MHLPGNDTGYPFDIAQAFRLNSMSSLKMDGTDFITVLTIAGAAAFASPAGGLLALWFTPTSLFMSVALGFASGVLLGTVSFSMLPQALHLGSLMLAVAGFAAGFLAM
ncbi:MAG TPA: hypothetical protein VHM64_13090, partial [Candidatus Binatia bacterium]|nr:hypothetical protein [Candidatus Binatia bacterium]